MILTASEPTALEQRYGSDPVAFAIEVLRIRPEKSQAEILRLIAANPRVGIAACRRAGKTTTAAIASLWWLCLRPGCLVAVVGPTFRQVGHFMVALRSLWQRSELPRMFPSWLMLQDELRTTLADWRLIAMSAEAGERGVEGAHGRTDVMLIFDESRGIPDAVYSSLMQMTGGVDVRICAISTPGPPVGWFFGAFSRYADRWKTMSISAKDIPRLARHYEEQFAEQGDTAFFAQQVEGRFASVDSGDAVFDYSLVRAAMDRAPYQWDQFMGAAWPPILGCDVSGRGKDNSVGALRRGPNVVELFNLGNLQDEMAVVGKIAQLTGRVRAARVVIDSSGLGAAYESRLREVFADPLRRHVQIEGHNSSNAADDTEQFANRKAETAWRLRSKLRAKGEAVSVSLPKHDRLLADLTGFRWTTDSRGRVRIIDPSPSPDFGDSVLLTYARGRESVAWLD